MKTKSSLLLVILVLSFNAFCKSNSSNSSTNAAESKPYSGSYKNELKVNLFMSAIAIPEITYERILANNSIGIAVAVSLKSEDAMLTRSIILPYYRFYVGNRIASGTFLEFNLARVHQMEKEYFDNNNPYNYRLISDTKYGYGGAIGYKFLAKKGFVGELYLGFGKFFRTTEFLGYPRIGLSFGKRF